MCVGNFVSRNEDSKLGHRLFTYVLNEAERAKNKQTTSRLFCHTAVLVRVILKICYAFKFLSHG